MARLIASIAILALLLLSSPASAEFYTTPSINTYPVQKTDAPAKLTATLEGFLNAIVNRDAAAAGAFIDDGATVRVTDIDCNFITKAQLVDSIAANGFAGSNFFIKGSAFSGVGIGIFTVESISTYLPNSPLRNKSVWKPYNIFAVILNEAGTQFAGIFQYADRSAIQPNAIQMMANFEVLQAARMNKDIAAIDRIYTADLLFVRFDPDTKEPVPTTKSQVMNGIMLQFQNMAFQDLYTETAFAACELVITTTIFGGGYNIPAPDGNRGSNKITVGMVMSDEGTINNSNEFMYRPFVWVPPFKPTDSLSNSDL